MAAPGRRPGLRPWWSTWPGAIGLGVASLLMAGTTSMLLALVAILADPGGGAGTDMDADSGMGTGVRVTYLLLAVLFLALPVWTCWSARRRLLGFLLWGLIGSLVVLSVGLYLFGIL